MSIITQKKRFSLADPHICHFPEMAILGGCISLAFGVSIFAEIRVWGLIWDRLLGQNILFF